MMDNQEKIGRIAFREEGSLWNAYWADANNMQDPIFLGSIRMALVERDQAYRDAFINLMRATVSEVTKDILDTDVQWHEPIPAPEHERGGHG